MQSKSGKKQHLERREGGRKGSTVGGRKEKKDEKVQDTGQRPGYNEKAPCPQCSTEQRSV